MKVLYNPKSDNNQGKKDAQKILELFPSEKVEFIDVTQIGSVVDYTNEAGEEKVVLAGGDGTINHFINEPNIEELHHDIYYFPAGSGNDFYADVKEQVEGECFLLNPFIQKLPIIEIQGKKQRFINGVGYGIDGYCCEVADNLRGKSDKPINYTSIAIKGLLFYFKPANATVIVDGETYHYKKAWLAPIMNGRFYGGGMMITPMQNRLNEDGTISVALAHKAGKLKILTVFPTIFKGEHVSHTDIIQFHSGKDITVKFDKPVAAQIDGETVLGVTEIHGYRQ